MGSRISSCTDYTDMLTMKIVSDKIIFETLNIMKYKSIVIVLAVIAGILIWPVILIIREKPKPLTPISEVVADEIQQSTESVSAEVSYLSGKSNENKIVFEISLNTHSVDLDGIDFQKSVVMQKGNQTFSPLTVEISGSGLPAEASAKAGHHRSAMLSFLRVGVPLKIVFLGTKEAGRKEFEFEKLKGGER